MLISLSLLLGIATLQLVISTAHYITTLLDLIGGFIIHVNDPTGSDGYFADAAHRAYIAELFFYFTNVSAFMDILQHYFSLPLSPQQYVIGDAVMVK
jgi:hypothetical protein